MCITFNYSCVRYHKYKQQLWQNRRGSLLYIASTAHHFTRLARLPSSEGGTFTLFLWKGENGFGVSLPSLLGEEVALSVRPLEDGPLMGGRPPLTGGWYCQRCGVTAGNRAWMSLNHCCLPALPCVPVLPCALPHQVCGGLQHLVNNRSKGEPQSLSASGAMVVLVGVGCSVAARGESPRCADSELGQSKDPVSVGWWGSPELKL